MSESSLVGWLVHTVQIHFHVTVTSIGGSHGTNSLSYHCYTMFGILIWQVYLVIFFLEMIYAELFSNNFLTTFSFILTLSSYSLSFFFSLYYFWPIKLEKIKVVIEVVPKSCTYIITFFFLTTSLGIFL